MVSNNLVWSKNNNSDVYPEKKNEQRTYSDNSKKYIQLTNLYSKPFSLAEESSLMQKILEKNY